MSDHDQPRDPRATTDRRDPRGRRKPYSPPELDVLGDVRDVTLGGTPGVNDSGFPNTQPPV